MAFLEIATMTDRGTITIPASLRKKFNLKPGAEIALVEDEGKLLVIPIVDIETIRKDFPSRKEMEKELEKSHEIELELEK